MYWTVQMSSCVSAQGELVEVLGNGEITVRDGDTIYRGRPVSGPRRSALAAPKPCPTHHEWAAQP